MEARGIAGMDWFKETDKSVKAVIADAVAFADESPFHQRNGLGKMYW